VNLLRPTPEQMRRFALRETEPEHARSFEPIAAGPVAAVLILLGVGVLGGLAAPFVLLARALRRGR
jgi:hypothetical protein